MAAKAIIYINDIAVVSTVGQFQVNLKVVALDGSSSWTMSLPNIPGNIVQALFDTMIKQAVRDYMVNAGFTFGLFDYVVLLGCTLV